METINSSNSFIIDITSQEFWFLAKIMGPGILYGIENPTEKLSDIEQATNDAIALDSLQKAGALKIENGNQIILDKVLGALFFCCINADHVLIINNHDSNEPLLIYFKPQWQVALERMSGHYLLTAIKNRNKLFEYIIDKYSVKLLESKDHASFMIKEDVLEVANYFYQNGNIKKAVDILNNNRFPKELKTEQFLEAFNSPDVWIKFQMIYDLNDKDNCRNRRFELFQFSEMLYWVSHLIVSNETYSLMTYQAVTPEDANDSFNQIIP